MQKLKKLENFLVEVGQDQLLSDLQSFSLMAKKNFWEWVEKLDPENLFSQKKSFSEFFKPFSSFKPLNNCSSKGSKQDFLLGQEEIKLEKVGCLILAGGQGTRLGWEGPKGTFPITVIKKKSLFQIFSEKTADIQKQLNCTLHLAIMTSPLNHKETIEFFQKNNFFGLEKDQFDFFSQKMLPVLDAQGKWMWKKPGEILEAPDGNGGVFESFYESKVFHKFLKYGIKSLCIIPVDNPLANPFDAELVGFQERFQNEITIKCIEREAQDRMGLLVEEKGKIRVLEYSELPEEIFTATDKTGALRYVYANASLFCMDMNFLEKISKVLLPLHKARKKTVRYFEDKPREILVWKSEKFVFDVLRYASSIKALSYPRNECYAPLKELQGRNGLAIVQKALLEFGEEK